MARDLYAGHGRAADPSPPALGALGMINRANSQRSIKCQHVLKRDPADGRAPAKTRVRLGQRDDN